MFVIYMAGIVAGLAYAIAVGSWGVEVPGC